MLLEKWMLKDQKMVKNFFSARNIDLLSDGQIKEISGVEKNV